MDSGISTAGTRLRANEFRPKGRFRKQGSLLIPRLLRVLLLEDDNDDARLILRELRRAGRGWIERLGRFLGWGWISLWVVVCVIAKDSIFAKCFIAKITSKEAGSVALGRGFRNLVCLLACNVAVGS
jgi:hypothetical protein